MPSHRLSFAALLLALPACDVEPDAILDADEGSAASELSDADALGTPSAPSEAAADCCAPDSAPGCSDVAVRSCVCDADPYCCTTAWDALCVDEVDSLGCGTCDTSVACCEASGAPGCELPPVQSCVCAADPYCCATAWDALCVDEVTTLGCGTCDAVDIVITDLQLPTTACLGEDIASATAVELSNAGSSDAASLFHVGWYLSSDDVLDAGDRLLLGGRDQVGGLLAGASTSVNIGSNQIPGDATPGPQYLIVSADEFDHVPETDELDNVVASPITLQAQCAAPGEWAQAISGIDGEWVSAGGAIAVDTEGNTYVLASSYSASVELGGATMEVAGQHDVILASVDDEGQLRWWQQLGGSGADLPGGVGVDADGNVYVAGHSEAAVDLGGGSLPSSGGARDLWVASYTSTGAHRWSQRHGAPGATLTTTGLAVDDTGQLVVAGYFSGTTSVGGAPLVSASAAPDIVVLALDADGTHRWSRALGGTSDDRAAGVAVDDAGGAAITGAFGGTIDFGTGPQVSAGSSDGFLIRLDDTGATQWAHSFGDTGIDTAEDVVLDESGRAFMVGTFAYGTIDLGEGPLVASGSSAMVMASYDDTGALSWSRASIGGGYCNGRGITLDDMGHPMVLGASNTAVDLGAGPVPARGSFDAVYASYDADDGTHRLSASLGTAAHEVAFDGAFSPAGTLVLAGTFVDTLPVAGTTLVGAGGYDVFVASIAP